MVDEVSVSAYGLALIAGGFTVVGTLLGGWVTYRFAICLSYRNAKREAGARLRSAFSTELGALDPVEGDKVDSVDKYLTAAFPKHREAVREFAFYLKAAERERFENAWNAFYLVGGGVLFHDYMDFMSNGTKQQQFGKFKQRVEAILAFTRD